LPIFNAHRSVKWYLHNSLRPNSLQQLHISVIHDQIQPKSVLLHSTWSIYYIRF
jgi:hypothetical protein